MITLSTQQTKQLQELMIAEGYGSESELLNVMIADFKYQQHIRRLRQAMQEGIESGDAIVVNNIPNFLQTIKNKAKVRI